MDYICKKHNKNNCFLCIYFCEPIIYKEEFKNDITKLRDKLNIKKLYNLDRKEYKE